MNPSMLAISICAGLLILSSTVELEGQNSRRMRLASDDEVGITPYEKRILQLEREAVEHAFSEQIVHLYQTWMKDDTGQPDRAGKGAAQDRRAFIRSMTALEQRLRKTEVLQGIGNPGNGKQ